MQQRFLLQILLLTQHVSGTSMLQNPANRTHNPQLRTRPATLKPQHEIPQAATTV